MRLIKPEDIEPIVYERFPVTQDEQDCQQIKHMAEKARAAYRQKLAMQYKQQQNESAATATIQ